MPEDDKDEEWTPQDMHECSDSSDKEDNQDENVTQTSTEVEVPITQDTIIKESVKGNAKRREYMWGKKYNNKQYLSIFFQVLMKE